MLDSFYSIGVRYFDPPFLYRLYFTGGSMFDSLADRMKQDQQREENATQRAFRTIAAIVIALVVFGGLYFVVRLLE